MVNGTSVNAFARHTRRSGQLNSSKTSWKSSMAPSVISMMAWLHRLPWPSAVAWEAQSNFISKAGYPAKTQQVSRLFFRGTNLVQDLERFLHCILHFALSLYMKLVNQKLKVLQWDAQQTNTLGYQMISTTVLQLSAFTKEYLKDRKAKSDCENKRVRRERLSPAPWLANKWRQRHYNPERYSGLINMTIRTPTHTLWHVAVLLLGSTRVSASWNS